jgi:hypothetical protein
MSIRMMKSRRSVAQPASAPGGAVVEEEREAWADIGTE